jgi:putative Mg2+ transporter-C (MgtC) family protein
LSSAFSELAVTMPDTHQLVRVTVRLLAALLVGTLIGLQRELTHKPAGLRTHMLLALGTALFVIGAAESGISVDAQSRILQGLATGIGFLGAGAILKLTNEKEIHGLTTAAGIWMTAAASAVAGMGQVGVALIALCMALVVLVAFHKLEKKLGHRARKDTEDHNHVKPDSPDLA